MSGTVAWQAGVPEDLRALAWRVFFTSRGRGISLLHHVPWIDDATGTASVCARAAHGLVGGLVVRRVPMADGGQCGLVGLVCVDDAVRGLGWAHRLLDVAIAQAQQQGLAALLLWTQKPEVYARHGFVCDGVERLGDVVPGLCEPAPLSGWVERPWPSGAEEVLPHLRRGMPAFARSARHLCVETVGGLAQAIVLDTAGGPAVAEWQGDEEDVARLLVASLPGRWTCNAIEGDRLLEVLRHQGCTVQLRPTGTRFVRWLTPQTDRVLPTLRVLDRI